MDTGDEGAIDLDLVEAEIAEIAQRRVASTEIVERDLEAERADGFQDLTVAIRRFHHHALGDLEHDTARVDLVFCYELLEQFHQVDMAELHRREVDRHFEVWPAFGFF